jgi:intracellular sulfur oxidation DsrE/DsrF family protein
MGENMTISRKTFLSGGALAAGVAALSGIDKARAEEPPKKAAMPPPPPPSAVHFPVLKPADYDQKKVMAAMQVKKPHKVIFQSVSPHLIIPGLSSLYIHIQNALNAGEFSQGWGKGNVASGAVLYGPSIIFALNDSVWAKYKLGAAFNMMDAKGQPETSNVYYKAQTSMSFDGDPGAGGNVYQDWSAEACIKRGTSFFVCHNALTAFGGMTGMAMGMDPGAVVAEWKSALLPGFMIVPAGVGALHVAQEQGWKMLPLI